VNTNALSHSAFDACLSEALSQTRQWLPRWLDHVGMALREREQGAGSAVERQAFIQARLQLDRQREGLQQRYVLTLSESVQTSLASVAPKGGARAAVKFDELELMGDDQVQEAVEIARLQQVVAMALEDQQTSLTSLLCGALGLSTVSADANPLRGETFVQALMATIKGLGVEPSVRARWLQAGASALGKELAGLFAHLVRFMNEQGVRPAALRVTQTGGSSGRTRLGESDTRTMEATESLLTLDHLHQLLVGNLESAGNGQGGDGMVRSLATEVVTLMLENIASDERLLRPVRDMILGMKPALLDVARADPRFFADRHNPARRLLDAITERSLAYTGETDEGYAAFATELRGIQRYLLAEGDDRPARFPDLLGRIHRFQHEALEPGQLQARGRAVHTLVRVEQRQLLAERVVEEFRARPDYAKAPGVVRRFLTGPWALVVAEARLTDSADAAATLAPNAKSLRYTDILGDLLWSCQLAQASLNRPRLVKIIPGLLRTLREGLDDIDYPRERAEAFFQALMGLHEAAYRTQRPTAAAPADDVGSRQNPEDAELWMQGEEARAAGFVPSAPMSVSTAFQETRPMLREWAEPPQAQRATTAADLRVGAWFDMWREGLTLRCQLTWASPHGTLFLFNTADGRSLSMTLRGLTRLMDDDKLRVIADHSVVDEALDAVAEQALVNSGKA